MNREEYIKRLEELNLPKNEFIILSGGSLLMHGLRDTTADLDLCASKELAEQIGLHHAPKDDKGFFTPFENVQMMDDYDRLEYDVIDGYKCETLESILEFKRKMMRPKDLKDIEAIENNLEEHRKGLKICICCSLSFTNEVKKIATKLESMGHEVLLPNGVEMDAIHQPDFDPIAAKHDNGYDAIREHFDKIKEADVVLICNITKKGIQNYIGANTFLEAGFAYYLGKPIYALNPLPEQDYIHDEINALEITVNVNEFLSQVITNF